MTESGLRLVTTSADASIAAVRALSECACTNPLRKNRTVPFVPFAAPVAKATVAWEELSTPKLVNPRSRSGHRAAQSLEDFRATNPGKFTSADFSVFAGVAITVASTRMNDYARKGVIERAGKAGRNVIWKFTDLE
jgi:hypothetical protein